MTSVDRQQAFSGTKDAAPALRIDVEQLERYLNAQIERFAGPLTVRQFKGGQSNPTYLLETPARSYVLRRKPPGKLLPSAHAVDREYRVISALHAQDFPSRSRSSIVLRRALPARRFTSWTSSTAASSGSRRCPVQIQPSARPSTIR